MSTNEINRDLGILVRDKTREILKLRKELREAEARVAELEPLVPGSRDVVIKAKAQFPAGVSVGEVVEAITEKIGLVELIHKHLGYYLEEKKEQSN